jgi:hypothetical protein
MTLEEEGETFPREVTIMREHFSDVPSTHRVHGDAVGKAIAFIASIPIQGKAAQERFSRLRQHLDVPMAHGFFKHSCNDGTLSFTCRRKIVE